MKKSEKPIVQFFNFKNVSYQEMWDLQTKYHNELKENKLKWRNLPEDERTLKRQIHKLIFCEHNPVYTLGKSGSTDHLLMNDEQLVNQEIEYFKINRGGDITYHGPGQLTGYPIFDMDEFYSDIHKYVRMLEECIILLLKQYGIKAERIDNFTGVWIKSEIPSLPHRKICAIGVHLSRWVTMHGFALNVNTQLSYFNNIIPCGIVDQNKTVTSMQQVLGRDLDMKDVMNRLKMIFADQFEFQFQNLEETPT